MREGHAFASLSPRLLARKGSAKPAMRRGDTAPRVINTAAAAPGDDLGWNDWGIVEDVAPAPIAAPAPVAAFVPEAAPDPAGESALSDHEMPQVLRQIEQLAWRINQAVTPAAPSVPEGRRAAFTLRLDSERHFRLRMAGVVLNRSAQILVTEALDKYLSEIPEVAHLRSAAGCGTDARALHKSKGD